MMCFLLDHLLNLLHLPITFFLLLNFLVHDLILDRKLINLTELHKYSCMWIAVMQEVHLQRHMLPHLSATHNVRETDMTEVPMTSSSLETTPSKITFFFTANFECHSVFQETLVYRISPGVWLLEGNSLQYLVNSDAKWEQNYVLLTDPCVTQLH